MYLIRYVRWCTTWGCFVENSYGILLQSLFIGLLRLKNVIFFQVQSRSRSVVELQVSGVRLSFTKRPYDTSLTLSVHGLLLVDALQTFGPDFELLVASHKHVGFVLLPVKSMWCVYLSTSIKGLTYC